MQISKEIFTIREELIMLDLYNELLQKSIDREAKKILSGGATAEDRYGHLLDSVKDRNLKQEEKDRKNAMISRIADNNKAMREQRERESKEDSQVLNRIINDVRTRERREANDFLNRNKRYLDKAEETMRRERNKNYFS